MTMAGTCARGKSSSDAAENLGAYGVEALQMASRARTIHQKGAEEHLPNMMADQVVGWKRARRSKHDIRVS